MILFPPCGIFEGGNSLIAGKTIVYTSGTFDMLHINHLKMIEYARSLGDILIVGVNTDELVATYKSEPIIPFEERIALMKALKYPDIVIPQHSLDHKEKAKKLNFDVFVVGDDWAGKFDYLKEQNVSVVYFPYGKGVTSTNLKEKIYKNYEKMKARADSHFSGTL
jgi:choline-phosphate cytidylyltransferase/glycerol-3-phosphate cytidylyltransferase